MKKIIENKPKKLSIQEVLKIIEANGYSIGNGNVFDPKEYRQPIAIPIDEIKITCDYDIPPNMSVAFHFSSIIYNGIYDSSVIYRRNDCVTKIYALRTRSINDFYILEAESQTGMFPENWLTYPEWVKKYGKS